MENRRFVPTDVGKVVNRFLTEHFSRYVDYEFTAQLENSLDAIARGESEWLPLLREFWTPFRKLIEHTESSVTREQASQARVLGTDPKSGRPMSVRMGRYGAFVQIGTRDDEEKPLFAGLRPGQKMDDITMEEALDLFKLPRNLGETPDGEPVSASIGRFGPYVRYGKKYVSIRGDDPYTINLERALELVEEKKLADLNRIIQDFPDAGIQVLNGRYGPYITDGKKNARVPKNREPGELTLEECQTMVAAAPERRGRRGAKKAAKKTANKPAKKKTKKAASKKTKNTAKKTAKKRAKKKTAQRRVSQNEPAVAAESASDRTAADDGPGESHS
jgi:DNA topoisomerase-1